MEQATADNWRSLILATMRQAEQGDDKARRWLSDVVLKDRELRGLAGLERPKPTEMDRLLEA